MKQILVDTNVLVSFLTDRNKEQQEQAGALFRSAAAGEHIVLLHQMALSEMVFVLLNVYHVSTEEIAETLQDLLAMPGTAAIDELSWLVLLDLWPDKIPSFVDAALAAVGRHLRCDAVASFDDKLLRRLKRQGLTTYWDPV